MKKIWIEDWYAPGFRVKITPPGTCPLLPKRRRGTLTPLFRTTHPEWCKSSPVAETRRRRFSALRAS